MERPENEELLAHAEATLGATVAGQYKARLELYRPGKLADDARQAKVAEDDPEAAAEWIPTWHQAQYEKVFADIWQRMHCVSCFVQSVKQQFTNWHNKRVGRVGTLWESRFRCASVEGGAAVAEIAAYIDLNPVRAGMVADPKDYKWSQYGAAVAGDELSQRALGFVADCFSGCFGVEPGGSRAAASDETSLLLSAGSEEEPVLQGWEEGQRHYRMLLCRRGLRIVKENGEVEGVFSQEEVERVWEAGGALGAVKEMTV